MPQARVDIVVQLNDGMSFTYEWEALSSYATEADVIMQLVGNAQRIANAIANSMSPSPKPPPDTSWLTTGKGHPEAESREVHSGHIKVKPTKEDNHASNSHPYP